MVASNLCTFVEDWFEKSGNELLLASFPDILRDIPPHVCNKDDVHECLVSAKLAEHLEVTSRDPSEPLIGNTVDVNDPSET